MENIQSLSDQNAGQLTQFNAGGSHQENQNGGISQGIGPNGQQNMVEQGETKLNAKNYIYSDTLKVDKNTVKDFYFPSKYIGKTFAEVSKLMERPDSKRKYDSIEEASKKRDLEALMSAQETLKQKSLEKDMNEMMIKHPEFMSSMMAQQPQEQPMVDPSSAPIENPQIGEQLPPQSPMAKMGGFQNHYGLGGDLKDIGRNYVTAVGDSALGAFGMGDVIKDSAYTGAGSEFTRGAADVMGKVGKVALPIVANMVVPGSGAVIAGAQQMGGQVNPQDNTLDGNVNTASIQQSLDSNGRPIQTFAYGGGLGNPPEGDPLSNEEYLNSLNKPFVPKKIAPVAPTPLPIYNSLYPAINSIDYSGSEDGGTALGSRPSIVRAPEVPEVPEIPKPSNDGTVFDFENQNVQPPSENQNVPWDNSMSFASMDMVNTSNGLNADGSKVGSGVLASHSGTLPDQGGIGTNETKQTALNAAGTYLPAAYNIGMGLFGKVGKLNAEDYINNTKLSNWRNNINPQLKASDEAFASGHAGLRGSGAGGGAYLANMQALANQQGMQKAGIHANAENDYNSRQLQIDQMNASRGDQAAQMRLQIAQYNAQAKAAKTKTLQEGLGQIGQIAQSNTQNKLAASANKMYSPTYGGDQGTHTSYVQYLENLVNQNKNAKTN